MNTSYGYLKKIAYLVFVFIIIAFWGCGGGSSPGGNEDVAGKDIIIRDIQIPTDSAVQDIQSDIESKDVIDDVKDTFDDIFDAGLTETIDDIGLDRCIPNCTNKECGDDGCGGSCGSCGDNAVCNSNKCECKSGFGNCNDRWDDGCEANFSTDPHHCSDCATDCGDNSLCNNKTCACQIGYANCDGLWFNGCEINLNNPNTCGTNCSNIVNCGQNSVCNSGSCGCISGYYNCNSSLSDGCEKRGDIKHLWSKRFGGSYADTGYSVSVDSSGNVYITGYFSSSTIDFGGGALTNANAGDYDIFLARFDSNGNHLWSKSFGGSSSDYGTSVSVDSSGNVYITGEFGSSTIDFGGGALTNAGGWDIFLAKFDSNGNHKWSKRFGGSYADTGYSVSVDSSGNVYITGYFDSSTIDFGGGALTNAGNSDIFLAKFDSNGNHLWSKRFGGSSSDIGYSVSVDSSGNVYITGRFYSSTIDFGGGALTNAGYSDIFLARFDSNGNHKWSKRFGGSSDDRGSSVSVDSSGNVYITGYFDSSTIDFGGGSLNGLGTFLAKFDSDGKHLWSKSFVGGNGYFVSVDSSGNVYGTGYFQGSNIDFGGCPLSSAGGYDIYLIKYAP